MSKEEKCTILFGKSETRIVSQEVAWNNDSACLPLLEIIEAKTEKNVA